MEKLLLINNCATNIKGVFAGGDSVNGGKEVVDAVQAGKDGAKAILTVFDFGNSNCIANMNCLNMI